eukprot:gnl/MRDRNA2_/MRDRNA2_97813_c0_seq1.p1 gnl/MRDRNA2_/MRDRNA2_97813_c0~~gnl/MRDRNA2_/MRDRNA2_97813_c0_seq1.p1  ORF type:complete len:290 (-),score=29.53 gnl/MRDRNA2_/MRDRNA2_97813_c0_seq1:147-1016(-)
MGSATLQQRCQRKAVLQEPMQDHFTKDNEYEYSIAEDQDGAQACNQCDNDTMIGRKPKYDPDVRVHDFFNIVALVPLVLLNLVNWDWEAMTGSRPLSFKSFWTGAYFDTFWWTTLAYFAVDLLWVVLIPGAVKSPSVIIKHHLIVLMYIMVPFLHPKTAWCMGACMTVELNTWFLIARRYFKDDRSSPSSKDSSVTESPRPDSWKDLWLHIGFYTTWIGIRMILYPLLVVIFCYEFHDLSMELGTYVNCMIVAPMIQVVLVILNLKWSWDLFGCSQRSRHSKGSQKEGL